MPANTAGIIVLKTETMRTKFFILMMLICEKIVFAQAVYPIDKGAFSINGNIGIVTKGGDLYSSDGKYIRTLIPLQNLDASDYSMELNISDQPPAIYLLRSIVDGKIKTNRVELVK